MSSVAEGPPDPVLRLAGAGDARLVYEWRNDPWIVSLSTSRRPVTWQDHQGWFTTVLERPDLYLLFIIHTPDGTPAGTVRLDREGEDAVVTIYLLRQFTGRGLGPRALDLACGDAFRHWPAVSRIRAYVRAGNQPSLKAFARAGFAGDDADPGCPAEHLALVRPREAP
jgi:RimJ/RimL family protein N-acetyltransferase